MGEFWEGKVGRGLIWFVILRDKTQEISEILWHYVGPKHVWLFLQQLDCCVPGAAKDLFAITWRHWIDKPFVGTLWASPTWLPHTQFSEVTLAVLNCLRKCPVQLESFPVKCVSIILTKTIKTSGLIQITSIWICTSSNSFLFQFPQNFMTTYSYHN